MGKYRPADTEYIPIISPATSEILGHIAATSTQPQAEEKDQTAVLKISVSRISSELERMKTEKELELRNIEMQRLSEIELYDATLKNIREQVYRLDKKGKFIRVNDAVVKQTGYTKAELKTMSVFDINPALT